MTVENGGSRPNNDPYQSSSSWLAQVIDQASIISSWNSRSSSSPPTNAAGPVLQPNIVGSTGSTPAIVGQQVAAGTFFSSFMTNNKNESVGGNNEQHAIDQQQTRQEQQEQQHNTIGSHQHQGPNSAFSMTAGDQDEALQGLDFQVEIPSSATNDSSNSGSRSTERIEAILVASTSRRSCRHNNKNKTTRCRPPGTFLFVVRSSTLMDKRSSS
jgi:hypothetical protein